MSTINNTQYDERTTDAETSDEIRADIERQRHQMSDKIDAIQEQFQPERLKEQAQETVRDFVNDGIESIKSYLDDNGQEIGSSLGRTLKEHPIPTALIGLGVGWILVETLGGDDEPTTRKRYYRGQADHQNRGYGQARYPESGYGYRDAERATQYGLQGYSEEYTREMYDYDRERLEQRHRYNPAGGAYATEGSFDNDADSSMGDRVRNAAEDAASTIQSNVDRATNEAQNRTQQVAHQVGQQAAETSNQVRQQASRLGDAATHLGEQAQDQMDTLPDEAQYRARQAQYQARRTGRQVKRTMEDNPLTFGAVALGIGMAIGFLLPETRQEDRWMGDIRDHVVDAGQEMADDVANRAQNVVEQVRPEVEETARQVADELTTASSEAIDDVKQKSRAAAENIKETALSAKETARKEAEKAGEDVKDRAETAKERIQN